MINLKKSLVSGVVLFFSITGLATSDIRPEVANDVVAYIGQQGAMVWTLRIGERSANESLVQVEGVDHEWNLKIQKMAVEVTNKDTRYYINNNGNKFIALIIKNKCCGELYLPGESQPTNVGYSKELSEEGNAQVFLTNYMEQQK
ncbi:MAG: hypothetical protein ACRCSA_05065 [Morganella morganii]